MSTLHKIIEMVEGADEPALNSPQSSNSAPLPSQGSAFDSGMKFGSEFPESEDLPNADAVPQDAQDAILGRSPQSVGEIISGNKKLKKIELLTHFLPPSSYYAPDPSRPDVWVKHGKESLKDLIRGVGCSSVKAVAAAIAGVAVSRRTVEYAGALAGHRAGLINTGSSRVLITSSPTVFEPKAGDFSVIGAVIEGLLGDQEHGETQIATFHAWTRFAHQCIRKQQHRPGQLLAIAGPAECGKSLLVDLIVVILGGRRANPYQAWRGLTTFNADLAGSEALVVDDAISSSDIRARKAFAGAFKENIYASSVRIHPKGKDAFNARPVWRVIMACNDNPADLLVLPPLDDGYEDKCILLRAQKFKMPMPIITNEEKEAFFSKLKQQIPAYLYWLENTFQLPEELHDAREVVRAFHHPTLAAALSDLSPEISLLNLIDYAFRNGYFKSEKVKMTAQEIKAILIDGQNTLRKDAESLLSSWNAACGVYLAKLAISRPERVRKMPMRDGYQTWLLVSPES